MDINKIMRNLDLPNVWDESVDYKKDILKEIELWLEEETEKQDYIEENLRSE